YLLDLSNGDQIANSADLNPQVVFGEDVMSRIAHAMKDEKGRTILKQRVLEKIDELAVLLCSASEVPLDNLSRFAIVGNTAMHHLALGLNPASLGLAPYEPQMRDAFTSNGKEIGLKSTPDAEVYFAPNVAGFVGGDTLAFILSQRLDLVDDVVLGIDIGTNGEIVLSKRGELFCCSAAAGSAFEGATISHGMRGQDGAIEHLAIQEIIDAPEISVIGGGAPRGLCGSAIVDTVAELLRNGIIDAGGRMKASARVEDDTKAGLAYLVAGIGEHSSKSRITFTQKDVRQVQLAKGAILTGTQILMQVANVRTEDIKAIYLAGAFGNYIDPSSALQIGLFPPVDLERIIPVGNAAGEGAKRLLVSSESRKLIEKLRKEMNYYELATHDNFADVFAQATILGLPRD
ncbi:MAG: ASKHA domain-containing protein, partial [Candidatus Thorarchaeota archaeon]